MQQIRLSYILPCYNTGRFVQTCIESLYQQNLPIEDFEVIAVNNAAEDNTEEIINNLQQKYANLIQIKLPKNINPGGACNAGLDIARGRYLQFVDSDDYLVKGVENSLLEYAEKNDLDLLYANIESFSGENQLTHEEDLYFNGNFIVEIPPMDGESFIEAYTDTKPHETMPVPAYRKIIRRALFTDNKIRFSQTTLGNDCLNNIHLLTVANRVANLIKKNYMFRYNPSSVTKSAMTPVKNVDALNNYTAAYKLTEGIKNTRVKSMVQHTFKGTLYSHMLFLPTFRAKEMRYVRKNVHDRFTIALIGGNEWAKMLYTPIEMVWFKIRRRIHNMLYFKK